MSFVESREFPVRRGLCFPCIFGSILLQWRQKRGKPMWIKKIPGIAVNVAVLILNVFVILMIVGLFLHQGTTGERVKETITRFSTTSQEYYAEGEAYSQTSDRVHTYSVEETR